MKKFLLLILLFMPLMAGCSFNKNVDEAKLKNIAETWITQNSPTYTFDGEDLKFVKITSEVPDCADCQELTYTFTSRHGGYGNRKGVIITQVLTDHTTVVRIKKEEVISVITDGKYNEMTQKLIK